MPPLLPPQQQKKKFNLFSYFQLLILIKKPPLYLLKISQDIFPVKNYLKNLNSIYGEGKFTA